MPGRTAAAAAQEKERKERQKLINAHPSAASVFSNPALSPPSAALVCFAFRLTLTQGAQGVAVPYAAPQGCGRGRYAAEGASPGHAYMHPPSLFVSLLLFTTLLFPLSGSVTPLPPPPYCSRSVSPRAFAKASRCPLPLLLCALFSDVRVCAMESVARHTHTHTRSTARVAGSMVAAAKRQHRQLNSGKGRKRRAARTGKKQRGREQDSALNERRCETNALRC